MPLPTAPTIRPKQIAIQAKTATAQAAKPVPQSNNASTSKAKNRHSAQPASVSAAKVPLKAPLIHEEPALQSKTVAKRKRKSALESPKPEPTKINSSKNKSSASKETGLSTKPKSSKTPSVKKRYVLDTNVLLHDPSSLFRFEDNDIFLPLMVLEELDTHKHGNTEVGRNTRQVTRLLDSLAASQTRDLLQGLQLNILGHTNATGLLYFQTKDLGPYKTNLPVGKADNQILGIVQNLQEKTPNQPTILVSKDINMRVKAHALGLKAEDYLSDKVLDDTDLLYDGIVPLTSSFWNGLEKNLESWRQHDATYYRIKNQKGHGFLPNQLVYLGSNEGSPNLYTRVIESDETSALLKTTKDYTHAKHAVWGISARNREQNFAMNLLMDTDIDLVTLAGTAGTGKTLLALACGLQQVLDQRSYSEIIMTRATVNLSEDIGFLPGTEEEKMLPWMGALEDNLEFLLQNNSSAGEWGRAATKDLILNKVRIKSLNFMRGRTFLNKYLIVDEAQNLTPKQIKALITRAGPGTKVVCLGNLSQIDTPYLTEGASGLTYAVDRFKTWNHSGHITLARGERSRLADYTSEIM